MTEKSIITMMREAKAKGLKTFSTGEPCARGHVCDRKVDRIARCVMCAKEDAVTKGKPRREIAPEELNRLLKLIPDVLNLITRDEARSMGLSRYFNGAICKQGHLDERLVSNHQCMTCNRIKKLSQSKGKKYYLPDPDEDGIIRNANPCPRCGCTERYAAHARCIGCTKIWNQVRESTSEKKREYYETSYAKNKKQYSARAWLRKKRIRDATPKNMSDAEKKAMAQFFKGCPEGYQVDHLVPLTSTVICGCHCMANLQYLPNSENRSKSNKWPTCQKSMQPACFDNDDNGVRL